MSIIEQLSSFRSRARTTVRTIPTALLARHHHHATNKENCNNLKAHRSCCTNGYSHKRNAQQNFEVMSPRPPSRQLITALSGAVVAPPFSSLVLQSNSGDR